MRDSLKLLPIGTTPFPRPPNFRDPFEHWFRGGNRKTMRPLDARIREVRIRTKEDKEVKNDR